MTLRNLGTVTAANVAADVIEYAYFVRLDFPSGPGTQRFTDWRGGDFTINVGSPYLDQVAGTWTATDVRIGALGFSIQNAEDVSFLDFANVDYTWTNWAYSPGLRDVPVHLYIGWFTPGSTTMLGSYRLHYWRIDDQAFDTRARLTLKPHDTAWALHAPQIRSSCMNIFKDATTCQYAGVDTVCAHTRTDCIARTGGSNIAHFNGFDLAPKPDDVLYWG